MIAALYVDVQRGPYAHMPDVDAWGVERDAATYPGPWSVVTHPPCGPWSRLAHMCKLQDGRLGPVAVEQVRRWGGVLEHPVDSRLWAKMGMPAPGRPRDAFDGYSVRVEQWWWGHRAVKPTWLYIVGHDAALPPFPAPPDVRPASGGRAARERDPSARSMTERLCKEQRHLTPPTFARWLVDVASRCQR